MRFWLSLALALLFAHDATALNSRGGGSPIPEAARQAGYLTHTFSTDSNFTTATVDKGLTYADGYQWYFWNFFGQSPVSSTTTLNSDGTMSVIGSAVSAAQINSAPYFVGTAFGGGGYFEAEIGFDPTANNPLLAWPSWWMMSLEHLYDFAAGNGPEQWAGQAPGYMHFMEVDTFEYDRVDEPFNYGSTIRDWYGLFNVTCPPSLCVIDSGFNPSTAHTPLGTDWTLLHRVGALWIPATDSTNGSYTFYFDDIQVAGPFTYSQFTTQSPPPTGSTPWTYGIGDQQHLVMILSTGWGPLNVRSVNVWQASDANNLHN